MTSHAICWAAALLLALCLLPHAHAQAQAPAQAHTLVLAHYMPSFPALGIDTSNT